MNSKKITSVPHIPPYPIVSSYKLATCNKVGQKHGQKMKPYKLAKIYRGTDEWFIYYSYLNPVTGKFQRFKERAAEEGLNREKDTKERNRIARNIQDAINELLQEGKLNPFRTLDDLLVNEDLAEDASQLMTVSQALDYALQKKAYKNRETINGRNSILARIKVALKETKNDVLIGDLRGRQVYQVMEKMRLKYRLTNLRYNAHLEVFKTLLKALVTSFIIPSNPADAVVRLKKEKPKLHKSHTDEERQIIATFLKEQHFGFYVYTKLIYRSGIRPKELLALKPPVIDVKNLRITVDEDITKDDEDRFVAVDADMMNDIVRLMDNCPKDYYIFHKDFKPGIAVKPKNRNYASATWKHWIHGSDGLGHLGIKRTMYALKHTGANTRRRMGNPLKAVSDMFGHSDEKMTLNYATHEKMLQDEEIRRVIPDFD